MTAHRAASAAPGIGAALAVIALVLAGCVSAAPAAPAESVTGWRTAGSSTDAAPALGELPVHRGATGVTAHIAADIAPPTNRWYSGIAFGETHRVFPHPLALDVTTGSFTVTLPRVSVAANAIMSDVPAGLAVAIPADAFEIVRADPVSVTARYTRDGAPVGDLTTAEGWPVIGFTAAEEVTLSVQASLEAAGDGTWSATIDGQQYGVHAPGARVEGDSVTVPADGSAQWFAVPADSDIGAWAVALGDPVRSVTTSFSLDAAGASTRLVYEGAGTTVVVPFDGREQTPDCALGTFETPYGTAPACASTSLEWTVARQVPRASYDFTGLDDATRARIVAQLADDLARTPTVPADTYFGGKGLARIGTLLSLASALGAEDIADAAADRLARELDPWLDTAACATRTERCFAYDDTLRLVVAGTPSFGSEEGNDHHFHYGYFLAAGAALVAHRPELLDELAPVMDVLAADIASGASDGALPALRAFDPYRGHSWASGLSPFADGNNQESSSEAVAAWNGLALWAAARHDPDLAATAEWLLSAEAAASRSLWLEPDLETLPEAYAHTIVSLTWSAKRDYATWFSGEPSAILGIQALPIGPVSLDYLAGDPQRVALNVQDAGGDAAFTGPLGEYVLQYSALGGADALARAESHAAELDPAGLDDGTSLSAILAWLAAVRLQNAR